MTVNFQLPPNLPSELAGIQVVDISNVLPVNPRYTWPGLAGVRIASQLTTIVFHHDAWPKKTSAKYTDLQLAKEIAGDHIRSTKNISTGDAGFPYHIWVRNGIIYLANPLLWKTWGVKDNNAYTVHICLSGDYVNFDKMTDADRKAMYLAYFIAKGQMQKYNQLKGHKELSATSCPGYDMNQVRSELFNMEQEVVLNNSDQKKEELAFRIANQILYFYNMSKGKLPDGKDATDGQKKWARDSLLTLQPEMTRLGYLK